MRKLYFLLSFLLCLPMAILADGTFTLIVVSEREMYFDKDNVNKNFINEISTGKGYVLPGRPAENINATEVKDKYPTDFPAQTSLVKEISYIEFTYKSAEFDRLDAKFRDAYDALMAAGGVPTYNYHLCNIDIRVKENSGSYNVQTKVFNVPSCWMIDKVKAGEPIIANVIWNGEEVKEIKIVDDLVVSKLKAVSAANRIVKGAIFKDVRVELEFTDKDNWHYISVPYNAKLTVYDADGKIVRRRNNAGGINCYWLRKYSGSRRAVTEVGKEVEKYGNSGLYEEYEPENNTPIMRDGEGFIIGFGDNVKTPVTAVWEKTEESNKYTIINGYQEHKLVPYTSEIPNIDMNGSDFSYSNWHLIGTGTFMKLTNSSSAFSYHVPVGNRFRSEIYNPATATDSDKNRLKQDLYPFKAFFVQFAGDKTFDLIFENKGYVAAESPAYIKESEKEAEKQEFDLLFGGGNFDADVTHITLDPEGSIYYEICKDFVYRLGSGKAPQFYTIDLNNHPLSYTNLGLEDCVINLGYAVGEAGHYNIGLNVKDSKRLKSVLLYDALTGGTCELTASDYYFTSDKGTFNDRFSVTVALAPEIETGCDYVSQADRLTVWSESGSTVVDGLDTDSMLYVYDAMGRCLYSATVTSSQMTLPQLGSGVYLVKNGTKFAKVACR